MTRILEDSDLAKLFFTDSGAGVTINLWPWIVSSILLLVCESQSSSSSCIMYLVTCLIMYISSAFPLLAGVLSSLYVPMTAFYKAVESNYHHGRNDDYYDDYDYDSYDR